MGRLGTIAIDNQHIQNVAVVDHEVDFHRVGLGFLKICSPTQNLQITKETYCCLTSFFTRFLRRIC